jgi:uncharacterized membrane protein
VPKEVSKSKTEHDTLARLKLAKEVSEEEYRLEAEHLRLLEKKAIEADIARGKRRDQEARLGQIFGLIIGLSAIFAGSYAIQNGSELGGGLIGSGGIIGLVAVFVLGRQKK